MSDNSEAEKDLTELSDEEIKKLSQEFTEAIPETMAEVTGMEEFGRV